MLFRTIATSAVLAIALALVGAVAGPQWDPVPVTDHIQVQTSDTTIGGQDPEKAKPIGTYKVEATEVTIQLDGTSVKGLVRMPIGVEGEVPGVVFVHGAGTAQAETAFTDTAQDLTSTGIATLVPSKRLDTYSTSHRDYVAMAGDYDRSVKFLQAWPGVDSKDVGVYGESEGCWIVPVMAVKDPSIAFTALVSAPVVPPREQAAFAVDSYLRNTDVPHGVFRAIPRAVGMNLPGGGFGYIDFDVHPYQEKMTKPILVVYGTADASMPTEEGAEQIIADAKKAGNNDVTVRYYKDANHGIKVDKKIVPDFPRDLSAWILSLPTSANAEPRVAGAQPTQQYLAERVPSTRWYGNGDWLIGVLIFAVALLVVAPLGALGTAVCARVRHRTVGRLAPGMRGPLIGVAIGSVVTLIALLVYLLLVAQLALNYEKDGMIVKGGWIVVRLLGLATVVAGAILINRWVEFRHRRKELTVAEGGRSERLAIAPGISALPLWGVLVGSAILLVVLAYWGVYQLGI